MGELNTDFLTADGADFADEKRPPVCLFLSASSATSAVPDQGFQFLKGLP
jgi:hypothetical protein